MEAWMSGSILAARALMLIAACAAVPSVVTAQPTPTPTTYKVRLRQFSTPPQVIVVGGNTNRATDFVSGMTLDVRRGERITLGIADANKLVFEYKLGAITRTATENYEALQAFGAGLAGLPAALASLAAPLAQAAGAEAQAKELIQKHGLPESTARVGVPLTKGQDLLPKLGVNATVLQQTGALMTDISRWARAVDGLIRRSERDPSGAKAAVAAWRTTGEGTPLTFDEGVERLREHLAVLRSAHDALIAQLGDPNLNNATDLVPLLLAVTRADEITRNIAVLEKFVSDMREVGEPFDFDSEVPYLATQRQAATIEIKRRGSEDMPAKYAFAFEPRAVLSFGYGAATVYSWAPRNESGDPSQQKVAGMLTITPRVFSEAGLHFQVGTTPEVERFAFFTGVGVHVVSVLDISAGWTWQDVLPGEERRFEDGFYLGVTVQAKDKK
jgi:hypothetical protein